MAQRPLTWREQASEIIFEAVRYAPIGTPLKLRIRMVDEARPWWAREGGWPRRAWQAARRAYLVQYGYRSRTKFAARQMILPLFTDPPPKEAAMRQTDIRMIHACARAAGFDEELRRSIYRRVTGRESLTEMTDAEVRKAAEEMRRLAPAKLASSGRLRKASPNAHVRLVYALWWRLADAGLVAQGAKTRPERRTALNAFINARFESHLNGLQTDVDFLTPALAAKVVEAFKAIAARGGLKLETRG